MVEIPFAVGQVSIVMLTANFCHYRIVIALTQLLIQPWGGRRAEGPRLSVYPPPANSRNFLNYLETTAGVYLRTRARFMRAIDSWRKIWPGDPLTIYYRHRPRAGNPLYIYTRIYHKSRNYRTLRRMSTRGSTIYITIRIYRNTGGDRAVRQCIKNCGRLL